MLRKIQPGFLPLGLLTAVYLPAFAVVSLIRPQVKLIIPLVIGISFCLALLFIWLLARRGSGFHAFGFTAPQRRDFPAGLLLAPPLAVAVGWLIRKFPAKQPFDGSGCPALPVVLY